MKLETLEKRRDKIKSLLSVKDELSKSFYGGMVGFKKGSARKKWGSGIDKELNLSRELKNIESKINLIKNPIVRSVSKFIEPSVFKVGQKVHHLGAGLIVEVIKINTKTVSVKYSETFKESIKANLLKSL
tara:strand:+ start:236 stop:625 length:390 start_codon:yes stop_codon:yes gene_type:complete